MNGTVDKSEGGSAGAASVLGKVGRMKDTAAAAEQCDADCACDCDGACAAVRSLTVLMRLRLRATGEDMLNYVRSAALHCDCSHEMIDALS